MDKQNSSNRDLIIIGAGGHGKVIADLAEKLGIYDNIYFLDDDKSKKNCMNYRIIGDSSNTDKYINSADFAVAIGNAKVRKETITRLLQKKASLPVLIHPNACIGQNVVLGLGTVIMAGTVINPDTTVGEGCIINTCSSLDHECVLEDYVHIAVGAHVAGQVHIGDSTWIGAGATVSNNIKIHERCMIGAGAVVVSNINKSGTYVGVPAKEVK